MIMPTHIVTGAGVVENNKGEILMVKAHHGGWVFPGGQVEVGETVIDAVVREIKEESRVDVRVDKLFAISSNIGVNKGYNGVETVPTKVMMDFICTYIDGELGISEENSESRWIRKEEVLGMITAPAIQERFKAYLNFDGNVQYLAYKTQPEFEVKISRKV